jgi:hypothetical protein
MHSAAKATPYRVHAATAKSAAMHATAEAATTNAAPMHAAAKAAPTKAAPKAPPATAKAAAATPGKRGRREGDRRAEHGGNQTCQNPLVHPSLPLELRQRIPPQERSGKRNRGPISND